MQKKTAKAPTKKIAAPSIISRLGKVLLFFLIECSVTDTVLQVTGALKEKTHQSVQKVDGLFVDTKFPADDSVGYSFFWQRGVADKLPGSYEAVQRKRCYLEKAV